MINASKHKLLELINKFKELLWRHFKTKKVSFNVELKPIKVDLCSCYIILSHSYQSQWWLSEDENEQEKGNVILRNDIGCSRENKSTIWRVKQRRD